MSTRPSTSTSSLEPWNIREKLVLASTVRRCGDHWYSLLSVTRILHRMCAKVSPRSSQVCSQSADQAARVWAAQCNTHAELQSRQRSPTTNRLSRHLCTVCVSTQWSLFASSTLLSNRFNIRGCRVLLIYAIYFITFL